MSWLHRPDRLVEDKIRSRFLVTMTSGEAFDGLLWDADDRSIQLKDAQAVQPDGSRVKADGDLFLPRDAVAYMQLLSD